VTVSGGLTFVALSAGGVHTCGLTMAGLAYCWGDNSYGQLGDGTSTQRTSPEPVSGGLTFAELSAANSQTCGVTTVGEAYCWGDNTYGQLGDGSTTERTSPVAVSGGLTFTLVSLGLFHSCGLTTAGGAYCWGANGAGQLGDGSFAGSQICGVVPLADYQFPCVTTPVSVTGGLTFTTVSTGGFHTCGVTTVSDYCWGGNGWGQLGNGGVTSTSVPVQVLGQP
jgi:alpha-tubulin suppressor-like RCC1 family protein